MSPEDFWNGPTLPMTSLFLDKSYENFGVSRLGAGTVCFRNISSFILAIVLFARRAVALQRTVWGISCLVLLHLLAMIQACSHHSAIIVKSQWPTQANHIAIYFHKKNVWHIFNPYSNKIQSLFNPIQTVFKSLFYMKKDWRFVRHETSFLVQINCAICTAYRMQCHWWQEVSTSPCLRRRLHGYVHCIGGR